MPDSLISPDGKSYWDGQKWVPMQPSAEQPAQPPVIQVLPQQAQAANQYSPDGMWWWSGSQWVPASQAPVPPPQSRWATPVTSGRVASATGGAGLMYQLGGPAAWSIGFGVASIAAPLFTSFYFPIMPIFGFLNAVRAFQRGRVIGGAVGVVLNILGGIMSLVATGLLFH